MLTRRYFVRAAGLVAGTAVLGVLGGCGSSGSAGTASFSAPATGAAEVATESSAQQPAAEAASAIAPGNLCVAEYAGNTLAVIDPATGKVVQRISAGQNPATVLVAAGAAYVGSSGGGELAVVPLDDPARVSHIPVGNQPLGLCLDEQRGVLYVGDYFNSSVHVVDTKLNSLVDTIKLDACGYHKRTDPPDCCRIGPGAGRRTVALTLAPEGDVLYCANYGTFDISRIDAESREEQEAFDGVVGPRQMIVSHDGASLYVAGVGGEEEQQVNDLYIIDRATGRRVREVPVGQSVAGVAELADGAKVLALSRDDGALVAFDPTDWTETARVEVGKGADTLYVSPDETQVFVANSQTGELAVLDADTLSSEMVIEGLASPKGMAVAV